MVCEWFDENFHNEANTHLYHMQGGGTHMMNKLLLKAKYGSVSLPCPELIRISLGDEI